MSVKTNGQRVFILVIVAVFLLTALGTTAAVIYDAVKNKDKDSTATTAGTSNNAQNQSQIKQPQEGKLEGTKLTGFTPVDKVDSLQKIDTVPGTGAEVTANSTITAHYTGALAKDGTIFQSSKDTGQPFTTQLGSLIPGWQEGLPGAKAGGTRRLVIPAAQAYGAQATGNIPANSDLVFDIEIIDVK